jgi:hypothetical protein
MKWSILKYYRSPPKPYLLGGLNEILEARYLFAFSCISISRNSQICMMYVAPTMDVAYLLRKGDIFATMKRLLRLELLKATSM